MPAAQLNRLRQIRQERGLSQLQLARAADLSRQSVVAIEAGRTSPGVDVALRLAQALACSLDDLFGSSRPAPIVEALPAVPGALGRTLLAQVGGRWVAHPLLAEQAHFAADGVITRSTPRAATVEPLCPLGEAHDTLVIMGCALGVGVLCDRLNRAPGAGRFRWLNRSSTGALTALASERIHVAGVHLVDARTGQANVVDVARARCPQPVVLITLARWEAGLVMRPGDARKIRSICDLDRPRVRLVTREAGAGAQRLLERSLQPTGQRSEVLARAKLAAAGHLELARAIASGVADVGVATRDVAVSFGLGFVPLADERYDLALPRPLLSDPRVQRLFDALTSTTLRRELSSMGYDTRASGQQVAEVRAA